MLITLEPFGLFCSNFVFMYLFIYLNIVQSMLCETMTRLNRASFWLFVRPSICQQLAKMLLLNRREYLNLIVHAYTCQHCLTTGMHNNILWWTRLCWASILNLWSVSENAHNSWFPWYNWFKLCILVYFYIVDPLVCKMLITLEAHVIFV